MKSLSLIIQFLVMIISANAQDIVINYMNKKDSKYVFTTKRFSEGKSKIEKEIFFIDSINFIKNEDLRIYLKVDSVATPIIGELKLSENIQSFLKNELRADYEFTSYLYVIISDTGDLKEAGISNSRGDYYYEYEMIKFLSNIKCWTSATYNNKNVYSIRYFRFNVKLE